MSLIWDLQENIYTHVSQIQHIVVFPDLLWMFSWRCNITNTVNSRKCTENLFANILAYATACIEWRSAVPQRNLDASSDRHPALMSSGQGNACWMMYLLCVLRHVYMYSVHLHSGTKNKSQNELFETHVNDTATIKTTAVTMTTFLSFGVDSWLGQSVCLPTVTSL